MYDATAPILKTITQDSNTHQACQMSPGEEAESTFDIIYSEAAAFRLTSPGEGSREPPPRELFYNDIDKFEHRVLFPEDFGEVGNPSGDDVFGKRNKTVPLKNMARRSTLLSMILIRTQSFQTYKMVKLMQPRASLLKLILKI